MSTDKNHVQLSTPASACHFAVIQPDQTPDADDDSLPTLTGYAIVWNVVSDDDRKVRVLKDSVTFMSPVTALYSHDTKDVMGNTANGTLRLASDDYGLKVEIDPPNTSYARDVCELVGDGYVAGMSFGCFPQKTRDVKENGETITEYIQILVDEVTICVNPAFPQTSITVADEFSALTQHSLRLQQLGLYALDID